MQCIQNVRTHSDRNREVSSNSLQQNSTQPQPPLLFQQSNPFHFRLLDVMHVLDKTDEWTVFTSQREENRCSISAIKSFSFSFP
jgi:hypothetical protein